mgnify:CR=1 FL=1
MKESGRERERWGGGGHLMKYLNEYLRSAISSEGKACV